MKLTTNNYSVYFDNIHKIFNVEHKGKLSPWESNTELFHLWKELHAIDKQAFDACVKYYLLGKELV